MKKDLRNERRGLFFVALVALVLLTVIAFTPRTPKTQAIEKQYNHTGADGITRSENPNLPYYDIRLEDVNSELAKLTLKDIREKSGKTSSDLMEVKQEMLNGEATLRQRVPTLKIEYNDDLRVPEVIGTDVLTRTALAETGIPANKKHAEAVRDFLKQNNNLFGLDDLQVEKLTVVADYTNPDGNLSYVDLGQEINGVPVFRGEVRAGITKDGRIFRMINNLAPGLDYENLSKDFGRPEDAVFAAARHINHTATADDVRQIGTKFNGNMIEFDRGQFADPTTAERMYFPTEPGVAVPAWRVLLYEPVAAYYVVVDTEGRMLWRKNIVNDQTQSATYNFYNDDSPAPSSPTTALPGANFQAPVIPRVNMTLIGNEAPNPGMNNLGWITDGTNGVNGHTDGNNAEAGLDRVAPDGVDAPVPGVNRVFNFTYNPAPGNPAPGEDPLTPAYQNGMVVNMFYWANKYHDVLYGVGFTEAARNFQNDNFGRGGIAADRLRVEGQDISGTNNANMLTPADGGRGRSQMYRFTTTAAEVDRDSGIDMDVLIHELTHGTSNRLIGNATGLGNNRGGSMGEGWSDFYARVLLSTASEDIAGIYSTGGWATFKFANTDTFTDNYYYGIRRFPYALKTTVGGPMMRPHNPQTFADIDPAQLNNADGAFARSPLIGNTATEVHNAGEIWCMNLLEVRARIITRLGFAAGNQRMLQLTTDGMKLTPVSPSFTQARDAILSASQALGGSDTSDIWAGFATRGQGFGSMDSTANSAVVESFNLPNAIVTNPFSVSDAPGDNDGFPEPGENVLLSVAVTNTTGNTVTNVMATVTGGGSANYGDIANGATVTRQIAYTVPAGATCGSLHQVSIVVSSSIGTNNPATREFRLGAPVGGPPVTFTSNTLVNIPNGQPTTTSGPAMPYNTDIVVSGLTGNKLIKLEITGITHTFPGDLDFLLVGPGGTTKYIGLSDSGGGGDVSNLTFTLSDAAAAQPSTTQWVAGDFRPYNSGANDAFPAPAPAAPYTNAAPGGTDTLTSVFGTNGANLNGTWSLYIVDDAGGDVGTMAGWKLTFEANDYACSLASGNNKPIADFDGDNKTDASIFRMGTWWINKSGGGTSTVPFGATGDTLVPGDYDADNKADLAVYRNGVWYVLNSSNGAVQIFTWGIAGDTAVPADYDGDGDADAAVYRNGTWFVRSAAGGIQFAGNWGIAGDVPVRGDFDGDGKSDLAVRRVTNIPFAGDTNYYILYSGGSGASTVRWGNSSHQSAIGDYNGDNKDDIGVAYSPIAGQLIWAVKNANDTVQFNGAQWGIPTDTAVTGDYDGDGKSDLAVFRSSDNTWYIRKSSDGMQTTVVWGATGDMIVPRSYQTP
jgi:subtilisin-like proprotein convertase family protein